MLRDFTWTDNERLIRFGQGAVDEAPGLLAERGFSDYVLLTTERLAQSDGDEAGIVRMLAEHAGDVLPVAAGRVEELSAALLDEARGRPAVAFGGGRVIDVAKAIAATGDGRCAAVPTTLAGAPMTQSHRLPAGVEDGRTVRPELVVVEPLIMASQPAPKLAASAMNSLAHAMESLYMPGANPVAELAALEAATLFAGALPHDPLDRASLALAGVLAGYAMGSTGLGVHHAVCQTIVRMAGTPHAETNAVMLPHFARLMAERAPDALGRLASALGDPVGSPGAAGGLIARLAARSGHTTLSSLGVQPHQLSEISETAQQHPGLKSTPSAPTADEVLRLLQTAL